MKKLIATGVLLFYMCPFAFLAMYIDFSKWSMSGYMGMIIATTLIAFFCNQAWGVKAVVIGNVVTLVSSYYFVHAMEAVEHWGDYFAPLTPSQLLIAVGLANLVLQLTIVKFKSNKWKNTARISIKK